METHPAKEHPMANHYMAMDQTNRRGDTAVSDWLVTLIIMMIPLVNFIMLFVWAFGGGSEKVSRANWAKAALLLMLIIAGLYLLLVSILGVGLLSLMNG